MAALFELIFINFVSFCDVPEKYTKNQKRKYSLQLITIKELGGLLQCPYPFQWKFEVEPIV